MKTNYYRSYVCFEYMTMSSLLLRKYSFNKSQVLLKLIDLLAKTDSIYRVGVEAAPVYKKIVKEYYSFGICLNKFVMHNL